MKRLFLTLTLGCLCAALHAQPYRPIPDSLHCEYLDASSLGPENSQEYFYLYATFDRISSGDSIFYLRKKCYDDLYYSQDYDWGFGATMTVSATPHRYILHAQNDDYVIRTNYVQGDTWTMCANHGLTAKFHNKTWENVLGVQDSVITITMVNQTGDPMGSMRLSKHYGILYYHLDNLPDGVELSLVSIPSMNMGTIVLNLPELFRYNTGDVLYYREGSYITYGGQTLYEKYLRVKVTDIQTSSDTTYYSLEFTYNSGNSFGLPLYSCILAVSPRKVWVNAGTPPMYFFAGLDQYALPFCSAMMQSLYHHRFYLFDENSDHVPEFFEYRSGEFGPQENFVYSYTSGFYAYRYNYHFANTQNGEPNRIEVEFITRFDASVPDPDDAFFTLSNTSAKAHQLNLYPVPCREELHVDIPAALNGALIKIIDLSGRIIMEYSLESFSSSDVISVSHLHKGSYLLQITSEDEVYRQVFIKE